MKAIIPASEGQQAIRRFGCFLALVLAAALGLVAPAEAAHPSGTIARANLDGSGVDHTFIPIDTVSSALAVQDPYIYWGSLDGVGRVGIDGSNPNPSFISGPEGHSCGLAVSSSFIYWTHGNSIGRATLDGSGANQNLLNPPATAGLLSGVAVDSSHIYWTDSVGIGRANFDGSGATYVYTGNSGPCLAVDGSHLYWQTPCTGGIGRSNLDGSAPEPNFIPGSGSPQVIQGAIGCGLFGVAAGPASLYGMVSNTGIGRANLDGSGLDQNFIGGLPPNTNPVLSHAGLALDASHIYWTESVELGYGKTVLVKLVSGTVSVKTPGGSFAPLTGSEELPVGTSIDATHGRVEITSAKKPNKDKTETGDFYSGAFKVLQPKHGKPTTELDLLKAGKHSRLTRLARGGKSNGLWGNGHGNYVTKGKHGSATVRGTIWFTRDSRAGTFFRVKKDKVVVRDFTRHRTKILHAGQHYLASAH